MTDHSATGTVSRHEFPFAQIPHAVIEDTGLSHTAVRVYAYLMRRADNETGNAFPGQRLIAKDINMSPSTVAKAITDLEERGWLEVTRRRTEKKEALPNHYVVRTTRGGVPNTGTRVPNNGTGGVPKSVTELDEDRTRTTELVGRPRDLLWEAIVTIHGQPATKTELDKVNAAAKQLRDADVDGNEYATLVAAWSTKHTRRGNPAPQPTVWTIAGRVGELRHFVDNGPILTAGFDDLIDGRADAALLAEQEARHLT